jgi:hypothetical protein
MPLMPSIGVGARCQAMAGTGLTFRDQRERSAFTHMRSMTSNRSNNSRFAYQAKWSPAFIRVGKLHPPRKQDRT